MDVDRRELHRLIDALPDGQVALMLADLRSRLRLDVADRPWPPAFFGMGVERAGRTDLSERVDEVLADGFGAPR